MRRIVFCPPVSSRLWNGETMRNGAGVSGSHSNIIYLAERFARNGWESVATGQDVVEHESYRGVIYVNMPAPLDGLLGHSSSVSLPGVLNGPFDLAVSDFGSKDRNYARLDARHLVIIMECPVLSELWAVRIYVD